MKRGEEKVNRFAKAMIDKLNEPQNVEKGGWKDCKSEYLIHRLYQEAMELRKELDKGMSCFVDSKHRKENILKEAADVANFAMMIADVVGALEEGENNVNTGNNF